jgi:hypothetical protein
MAVHLHSFKVDKDGQVRVRHTFYAGTEEEAEELMEAHADRCKAYGPALDAGETIEILEDGELPDVAALEATAEAQLGDDEDDEEEDELDPDAEEEEEEEDD